MAKRPSLVGSGRASLAAASGETPVEPEAKPEAPPTAARPTRRRRHEQPAAAPARAEIAPETPSAGNGSHAAEERRFDGRAAIFQELMAFGGERLQRAVQLGQVLSQCRTPAEALAAQSEFARETAAHYAAASYKLMRLASAAWAECWRGLPLLGYGGRRVAGPGLRARAGRQG